MCYSVRIYNPQRFPRPLTQFCEATSSLRPLPKSSPLPAHHTMCSIPLGKKQWTSRWDALPGEIRLLILGALIQDGCTLGRLATVSYHRGIPESVLDS
ncbi:hypothetical protein B0T25DRAFT_558646 [Lasiosphaeria hispida]|uniref:Uncharacterized protein n=1 Tax=Lasiosphaeria hispida TaxID=260671 RepID=A0AAJ0H6J0_9PEZI|nr:hypothetical protein B0T25DRAFT_558646 [Lasiosphaeria hispida]